MRNSKFFKGIKWDAKLIRELSKISGSNEESLKDTIQLICVAELLAKKREKKT